MQEEHCVLEDKAMVKRIVLVALEKLSSEFYIEKQDKKHDPRLSNINELRELVKQRIPVANKAKMKKKQKVNQVREEADTTRSLMEGIDQVKGKINRLTDNHEHNKRKRTCWNCGGEGYPYRECPSPLNQDSRGQQKRRKAMEIPRIRERKRNEHRYAR